MNSSSTPIVSIVVAIAAVVSLWRVFTKAGLPGWGAIIPIYNVYLLVKAAGRPGWWTVLYFVPVVNVVIHLLVCLDIAQNFGKSKVYGAVGLWLFNVIGFLILGFSSAQYAPVQAGGSRVPQPAAAR